MCMCECEWVGKGEWERRLIKILMRTGVGGGAVWRSACRCGWESERARHYADFPFSFKTLEEYILLHPGSLLPPMLPTFMRRQGWSEEQKSGNQVNYGWWLADRTERKRARERRSIRGGEQDHCFFVIIWLNTTGSLQQTWPDPTGYFVRSVVTLLTRSVLTQTSPLSAT